MTFLVELKSGKVTEGRIYPKRGTRVFTDTHEFANVNAMRNFFAEHDPIVYEIWDDAINQPKKVN